jgi:hypothetical protein
MMFSQRNLGREAILKNSKETVEISYILKNGKAFRIKQEENAPVVSDYTFPDIAEASCLTVSYDSGKTWQDIAIKYNQEDSPIESEEIKQAKAKKV